MATKHQESESETVRFFCLNLKDWFFDIIINFLRSPRWKTPIMSFLDENCLVFDNEEENKLEYTQIHNVLSLLTYSF